MAASSATCTFSGVSGSWTIPSVTGNGSTDTYDASWIGIGGVTASDLIQVGTENTVSANGTVSSACFYELLPHPALAISNLPITAGDNMTASLNKVGTDSWTIAITDNTTGKSFTTTVQYTSSLSSAEWIEEDPSNTSGLVPLDTFGAVTFTNGATTVNGTSESISAASGSPITMVDTKGKAIVTPGALTGNGESFVVTQN